MTQGYASVEVPDVAPALGGLFSVVTPDESLANRTGAGVSHLSPESCGVAHPAPGVCGDALAESGDESGDMEKEFDGIGWELGLPFGIYKGIVCDLSTNIVDRAIKALTLGEGVAVEAAVQSIILNNFDTIVLNNNAIDIVEAVALLEQHAGETYGGVPLLHVSRYGATYLGERDLITADSSGKLTTIQGTPVVNGAGYKALGPGAVSAESGQFWLYASGRINLWRGPIIANEAPALQYNENYALAERFYAVTRECFTAAVLVDTGNGS